MRDLTFEDVAAVVVDHRGDVLGWNPLGHALLAGHLDPAAPDCRERPNVARMLFLDPDHRALYRDWRSKAATTVSALHQEQARRPDDDALGGLVDELCSASEEFVAMWSQRPVRVCASVVRDLDHPEVGRLRVTNETLMLPDDDQQLGLLHARRGTPDHAALARLASRERRRGVMAGVRTDVSA